MRLMLLSVVLMLSGCYEGNYYMPQRSGGAAYYPPPQRQQPMNYNCQQYGNNYNCQQQPTFQLDSSIYNR